MANTIVKTPIVYYGGKTAILPNLLEMVPIHSLYTEAFFGGGTLFWAKDPVPNETINDRLDIVVNFYRVLKTKYFKLKPLINATLMSRTIHTEARNIVRFHKQGKKVDAVKLAWAFWVGCNFSYMNKIDNSFKYTASGTPMPITMKKRKQDFTQLLVDRIENAYIENEDAIKILKSRNVSTAFHYIDPPYCGADMGHYAGYTWEEYEALLTWCAEECKGKFLLSNYNSDMLDRFIKNNGWYKKEITHKIKAPRKSGSGNPEKTEVLVSNYGTTCGTLKLF